MKKHYDIEKQGQCEFFDNYRIDYQGDNSILVDSTDGIYNGNIMEFKLNINNTGKVLFQAIKYLSKMRIKGESIPARILLIDLNNTKIYVYNSIDYIDDIQKIYVGASSKGNDAFSKDVTPIAEYDYMNMIDSAEVQQLLINKNNNWYIPIDLDENCIVGWAERYYKEVPKATKGDFLGDGTGKINLKGEIREPKQFKGLINPYTEPTNEKFKYLMDCLNDRLNKKDLGAFYTPIPYCEKAAELVQMAVDKVPEGNDYIILDRCAGTGNLEQALYGKYDKNGDELISHCVVSTYEYYEYKVLVERIGQDVRNIIPPTEANILYANGKISNADAMSEDYINNPIIKQYINNPNCTIILFENPPYTDSSSVTKGSSIKGSYVFEQMKKDLKNFNNSNISTARDLANQFIWSGFQYYIRQNLDTYIIFSPIKYWKTLGIIDKEFNKGFVFNRKHFHASPSAITCISWGNKNTINKSIILDAFDILDNNIIFEKQLIIKKVYSTLEKYYDRRSFKNDIPINIHVEYSGYEAKNRKVEGNPVYNKNILGYLRTAGSTLATMTVYLSSQMFYNARGFYLRQDKYLSLLPLFVTKLFPQENWYDIDIYSSTSDGGNTYMQDKDLLKSCLLYTCLTNINKCISFIGTDGRYYKNELCFDNTNGNTFALEDLNKMKLDEEEKELLELWNKILREAKKTKEYNKELTYGIYQITKELNTTHEEGVGKNKKKVYDYPILNGYLTTLRDKLKEYYKTHITDKLFKYELLK